MRTMSIDNGVMTSWFTRISWASRCLAARTSLMSWSGRNRTVRLGTGRSVVRTTTGTASLHPLGVHVMRLTPAPSHALRQRHRSSPARSESSMARSRAVSWPGTHTGRAGARSSAAESPPVNPNNAAATMTSDMAAGGCTAAASATPQAPMASRPSTTRPRRRDAPPAGGGGPGSPAGCGVGTMAGAITSSAVRGSVLPAHRRFPCDPPPPVPPVRVHLGCGGGPVSAAEVALEGGRGRLGDGVVLRAGAAADADRPDGPAVAGQRDPPGEDHHLALVGGVDPVEVLARLRVLAQLLGGDVERARGPGLVDRDVDRAEPRTVHADVGDEVAA